MRIAIFGAGGVGGYFGARLAQAGNDVVFIARGDHLRAMQAGGLTVHSADGSFTLADVNATDDAGSIGAVDLVLVTVKTWQLDAAVPSIEALIGPDSIVLPLLNGVESSARLARLFGERPVLKGLTRIISHVSAPGEITHVGVQPTIVFKEPDNRPSERTDRLRQVIEAAGIRAVLPGDIDVALWEKFMFVVAVGSVGAAARAPMGVLREMPETRSLIETAMREILAVGRARGVDLEEAVIGRSLDFLDAVPPGGTMSLQRDISDGRPSELQAWTGAVVRLGEAAGTPTPLHGFIYHLLLPLERRARGEVDFST